jgi:hypothetical protein
MKLACQLKHHRSHVDESHGPHGGCQLSWFMTMIQSRSAHESGEQWKHEGHESFRQVRASMRITTLPPMSWCILIFFLPLSPPLPFLLDAKGVGFTRKIQVGYN